MLTTTWVKFKNIVKDKLSNAAASTRKYARIGKVKFGKMNINHSINNAFQELGVEIYNQISDGTKGDVSQSKKVKSLIAKVNHLKQYIKDKNLEIETIKQNSVS